MPKNYKNTKEYSLFLVEKRYFFVKNILIWTLRRYSYNFSSRF